MNVIFAMTTKKRNRKEYNKEWRDKNKEHLSKYNKEYWKRNKERCKEYYLKNHEEILKRQKQYREDNLEKLRERSREWYKNNIEKCKKRAHENYVKIHKRKKQFIDNYKLLKGCSICGYNKCAEALDFHHNGDKEFMVASGSYNINIEKIKKEMDKCIVLCANCHRQLHDKKRKEELP